MAWEDGAGFTSKKGRNRVLRCVRPVIVPSVAAAFARPLDVWPWLVCSRIPSSWILRRSRVSQIRQMTLVQKQNPVLKILRFKF